MSSSEPCHVRRMTIADLSPVLAWRNHPDTRAHMLSRHEISQPEHRAWFERSNADPFRALLIVEDGAGPLGFAQFCNVCAGEASTWGFYTVPGTIKGAGRRLCSAALAVAFEELQVHKVCGQAVAQNTASVKLHTALGFKQEGVLREQVRVDDLYEDMLCFGLLRSEWAAGRAEGS
jgi:UDP-4-amino-4,6-dideoxy-N-acetyl-beta-L-altrosamine N-acetyltransferase